MGADIRIVPFQRFWRNSGREVASQMDTIERVWVCNGDSESLRSALDAAGERSGDEWIRSRILGFYTERISVESETNATDQRVTVVRSVPDWMWVPVALLALSIPISVLFGGQIWLYSLFLLAALIGPTIRDPISGARKTEIVRLRPVTGMIAAVTAATALRSFAALLPLSEPLFGLGLALFGSCIAVELLLRDAVPDTSVGESALVALYWLELSVWIATTLWVVILVYALLGASAELLYSLEAVNFHPDSTTFEISGDVAGLDSAIALLVTALLGIATLGLVAGHFSLLNGLRKRLDRLVDARGGRISSTWIRTVVLGMFAVSGPVLIGLGGVVAALAVATLGAAHRLPDPVVDTIGWIVPELFGAEMSAVAGVRALGAVVDAWLPGLGRGLLAAFFAVGLLPLFLGCTVTVVTAAIDGIAARWLLFRGTRIDGEHDVDVDLPVLVVDDSAPCVRAVAPLLWHRRAVVVTTAAHDRLATAELQAAVAHAAYRLRERRLGLSVAAHAIGLPFGGKTAFLSIAGQSRLDARADRYAVDSGTTTDSLAGALDELQGHAESTGYVSLQRLSAMPLGVVPTVRTGTDQPRGIVDWLRRPVTGFRTAVRSVLVGITGTDVLEVTRLSISDRLDRLQETPDSDTTAPTRTSDHGPRRGPAAIVEESTSIYELVPRAAASRLAGIDDGFDLTREDNTAYWTSGDFWLRYRWTMIPPTGRLETSGCGTGGRWNPHRSAADSVFASPSLLHEGRTLSPTSFHRSSWWGCWLCWRTVGTSRRSSCAPFSLTRRVGERSWCSVHRSFCLQWGR